jgi:spore maturation protein CgeB
MLGQSISIHPFRWRHWQLLSRIPLFGQFLHSRSELVSVLMNQIKTTKPDVVYVLNINFLNQKLIRNIKSIGSLVVGQIASPLPPKQMLIEYDHIFSAHPGQVNHFLELGISSSWLPLAFDSEHYEKFKLEGWPERTRDVTFVGTFGRHQKNTAPLLTALAKEIPTLEIFTFAPAEKLKRFGLDKNLRGKAWGAKMHRIFAESKIVINRHGAVADGYSVNYRLFEGTGMGALVVTELGKNTSDLFEPGQEILTYDSIDEAVKVIKKALSDFKQYSKVAQAGQRRTLTQHTFKSRARDLEDGLLKLIDPKQRLHEK